ncbi:MAG: phosphatidylserine decarboxylase [Bdellovibrionales bacterium]|nr:phosphatidylserine decarboxylase [Bdellovibrionales bacterium]
MTSSSSAAPSHGLPIYDRRHRLMVTEKIFGESGVRLLYENPIGSLVESTLLCRPWFSKLYGAYQSSPLSRNAIEDFVEAFEIPMADYEAGPFSTFNAFFIRKFKPGLRPFEAEASRFSAPAEGRYLVFPSVDEATSLPVKGARLNGPALIGADLAERDRPEGLRGVDLSAFRGGPGFIARLCPVDYHRFHYPDAGKVVAHARLRGPLHSVNPIALARRGDLLFRNEREVTILETRNFGRLAYVEVGAICVGRIVQSGKGVSVGTEFKRGDEKGYFLFGGSTVIVLGEPGRFRFDADLVEKSAAGQESLVRLGEGLASANG